MKNFFLSYLTKAINVYLTLDPESTQRLHKLQGKAITIELQPMQLIFQCVFTDHGVRIHTDSQLPTQAKIRGTPLQMLGAVITKENRQRFFAEDLSIEGQAELANEVIALFDELQIDWEEALSRIVGDIPAHQLGRFVSHINTWLNNTKNTLTEDINEYIHEEAQWVPAREALQDFFTEIDTLRMDVDRIEVRVNQLLALCNDKETP